MSAGAAPRSTPASGGAPRGDSLRGVLPEEACVAATEAARLRLLGLLFERPRPGWAEEISALAAAESDGNLHAIAARALTATEGEYLAVFGPGGAASPREVAYRGFADPGRLLSELSGLYDAFAFRPLAEDPADHIAVEVGFAGYLKIKEAYAIAVGDRDGAARTREGRALFLEAHLRPFAAGLRARLGAVAPASHLAAAACLLADLAGCGAADLETRASAGVCGGDRAEDAIACGGCPSSEPASEA